MTLENINSAVGKELYPEVSDFASELKRNLILADIFDMLAQINANLCAMGAHKKAQTPTRYPRPTIENKEKMFHASYTPEEMREMVEKRWRKKDG